jgi:hypothetical protein
MWISSRLADCGSIESVARQRWRDSDERFDQAVVVETEKVGMMSHV